MKGLLVLNVKIYKIEVSLYVKVIEYMNIL